MLRAHIGMLQRLGFLAGQGQNLLHPGGVGNVADHLGLGARADLLLDLHADGLEIEPHLLKTLTATPCPSLIRPSSRCSVPT